MFISGVSDDPAVLFWLGRRPRSRVIYEEHFTAFFVWLRGRQGWGDATPSRLLARQRESADSYELLTLIQEWVQARGWRRNTKVTAYSAVRSFFLHNRVPLPPDLSFDVESDVPPVVAKLTLDALRRMFMAAKLRERALLAVMFQGGMGRGEYDKFNRGAAEAVTAGIRGESYPIRIDMPPRKRNLLPFYTFVGREGGDLLAHYFDRERGWPRRGEAVFLGTQNGAEPLKPRTVHYLFHSLALRAGLITPFGKGSRCNRYGVYPHEMRDVFKSTWHAGGADILVADFMMGHSIDKLGYDKVMNLNPGYAVEQFRKADPHLSLEATTARSVAERGEVEAMKRDFTFLKNFLIAELRERYRKAADPEERLRAEAALEQLLTAEAK